MYKHIGYLSQGKNEFGYVFHSGTDRNAEDIKRTLDITLVGGGPYKVIPAYIEVENESNN